MLYLGRPKKKKYINEEGWAGWPPGVGGGYRRQYPLPSSQLSRSCKCGKCNYKHRISNHEKESNYDGHHMSKFI